MELTSFFVVLTAIVIGLLGMIYLFFAAKFAYWKKKGVPYIKPSFPLGNVGDLISSRKTMAQLYSEFYKHFAGNRFAGIYMLHRPTLFLLDPDLIKNVLVKEFEHFHDHNDPIDESVDPFSASLFALSGKRWKDLRAKLSPAFSSGKMKIMFETVVDCGRELKNYFEEPADKGEIVEMKEVMARYTTDIIASCAFGIACNCLKDPDAEFRQWGRKVFEPTTKQKIRDLIYILFPSLAVFLKVPFFPKEITKFFTRIVKETVEYREKNDVKRNDFMQLLIQLKNTGNVDDKNQNKETDDVETLSLIEIASQAFMFFTAGFESSSTTMSFFLYEMALNPKIQKCVQDEVDDVLENHNGTITYEAIMEMHYLDKCISETLRKYPSVPFLNRVCTKAYKIPDTDVIIEEGINVLIPTMALQYDPQHHPDPEKFSPGRFSEKIKSQRHQYTYLPFGEGPRICIGMRFALMQIKVGLVFLLSQYQFLVCEKTSIPIEYDPKTVILCPKAGYWLQVKNRVKKVENIINMQ
ncbi:cytochrome P450 6k1-like isoform X2 [Periplaneta americana]